MNRTTIGVLLIFIWFGLIGTYFYKLTNTFIELNNWNEAIKNCYENGGDTYTKVSTPYHTYIYCQKNSGETVKKEVK